MEIKDKANAFDEALKRAKKLKETCDNTTVVGWMEYIFPELAEEEKTRKDLLNFLQSPFIKENICDWKVAPWIDWLNKQELTQSVTKISDKGWSEEDERMYKIALSCIETLEDISDGKNMYADVKDWLTKVRRKVI